MSDRRRLAVLVCLVALLAGACGSSSDSDDEGAGEEKTEERITLRLAASTQSGGFPTPYGAIRGPGRLVSTYLFDTLAFPDVTGEPKPWLAESWETSADGLTWTFHLHEDATFHDGTPVTADDVLFTFEYNLTGPGSAAGAAQGVTYIDTVTSPDTHTVVIKLKTVRPSFLNDIAGTFGFAVMPKHIWSTVTDPAKYQEPNALVGSGPYKLEKYDLTTNNFDFVANDDFYLGPPKVERLQVIPVADPLLALENGEVDAAGGGNVLIPDAQFQGLSKRFELLTARGEFNLALFFNPLKGFPYDQKPFRQGVVYGLDRDDMLERLVAGRGVPGPAGALGPGNEFLNKKLPAYKHDKGKAGSLLDSVGLKDADGDGLRDKPDGSPFTIPLSVSSSDTQQAQLVKEYLRAVGLNVEISAVDQQTSDARGASGDYEMAIQHFGGLSGDPAALIPRFGSTSKSTSFTRVHGYNNPEFDRIAAEQAATLDVKKRRELVDQLQAILAEDLPQISLYVPDQISFVDAEKYAGFAYTPGCPPCGVSGNKRMMVAGDAEPAKDVAKPAAGG